MNLRKIPHEKLIFGDTGTMPIKTLILALTLSLAFVMPSYAKGFLVGRTKQLPDLELALGNTGYGVSDHKYELETGVGYRLWIKSTGAKECAFSAPEFFANIWVRKLEVSKVEIKLALIHEIEFEREGAAELFFTPIKPGEYVWECEGLAHKGMTGKILVK